MSSRMPCVWIVAAFMSAGCGGASTEAPSPSPTDADGDGVDTTTDCDDTDGAVFPGQTDTCDRVDTDCDGTVDEDAPALGVYHRDADADTWGDDAVTTSACEVPPGYVERAGDCNDGDARIHPQPNDACVEGVDHDCDGQVDEDLPLVYTDADGDGDGAPGTGVPGCVSGPGQAATPYDCDDTRADTSGLAPELCGDAWDNNCNGSIDENTTTWCPDADRDGYGSCEQTVEACTRPEGTVSEDTVWHEGEDCDDSNPDVSPGILDLCGDDIDADCDGFDCSPMTVDVTVVRQGIVRIVKTSDAATTLRLGPDLTGEGTADLCIDAARADGDLDEASGAVYVGASSLVGIHTVDESEGIVRNVAAYSTWASVVSVGDLTGDGLDDLVGTLVVDTNPNNKTVPGVFYPPDPGPWKSGITLRAGPLAGALEVAEVDVVVEGPLSDETSATWGRAVRVDGDLTGDGQVDLVVSDPYADQSEANSGEVYLYPGPIQPFERVTSPAVTLRSGGLALAFGSPLRSDLDLNADGEVDLVVAAPRASFPGMCEAGAVFIFFGPLTEDRSVLDADVVIPGTAPGASLGSGITSGDLDGNGAADLVLVSPPRSGGCAGGGDKLREVHVYYGPFAPGERVGADVVMEGTHPNDAFAASLDAGGDLDGDGFDDLVVGCEKFDDEGNVDGAVFITYGPIPYGRMAAFDSDVRLRTQSPGTYLGRRVATRSGATPGAPGLLAVSSGWYDGTDNERVYLIPGQRWERTE